MVRAGTKLRQADLALAGRMRPAAAVSMTSMVCGDEPDTTIHMITDLILFQSDVVRLHL